MALRPLTALSLLFLALPVGTSLAHPHGPAAPAVAPPATLAASPVSLQRDGGAELREAARTGDIERVRELLAEGVEVDAGDRYGSTALFFAADRGHQEVVELLLASGADPNKRETFYGMSPVTKALMGGRRDIGLLLLERGATADAGTVLSQAVQEQDVELAEAALATGAVDGATVRNALRAARSLESAELVGLLETAAAAAAAGEEAIEIDPQTLQSYVGAYRNEDIGMSIAVSVEDGSLLASVGGQEPTFLEPTGEGSFALAGGATLAFGGRGGMVEQLVVQQGEQTFVFLPYDPEAVAAGAAPDAENPAAEDSDAQTPDAPPAEAGAGASGVEAGEEPSDPATAAAASTADRTAPIHWPAFRGADATGIGDGQGIPVAWNVEDGTNVRWKTPVPGIANSSPIVWGDRVFVTTAAGADDTVRTGLYGDVAPVEDLSPHSFQLYCLDKASGEILWQQVVYEGPPEVKRHPKSSQANSSPVTDGERVVVLFGTVGVMAAYDFDGNLLWQKDIGVLDSGWFHDPSYQWGHAASPVLYEGTIIVQADVQEDPFIAAYSLQTGDEVWRTSRDSIPSFSTPTLYRGEPRDELVTNGTRVRAYDPATGELLWWLGPNSELVVGTPVVADGQVFVTGGYPPVRPIYAVRPGGSGDISPSEPGESSAHVTWSTNRSGTYIPTPIVYRGLLYMNHNDGRLEVFDAATGEQVYRARIGGTTSSYVASPVAADGRLYFSTEDGTVHVVRAGPEYEHLAEIDMGEVIWATPAISDGVLVMRTLGHVWGIAQD